MNLEGWFEDSLPTKWSRRVALANLVLAGAAFSVPSILPPSYLPASDEEVFLLRIILLLTVALTGTLIVLILVVRAFNSQTREENATETGNEPDAQLSDTHQQILHLLFREPRTVDEVRQSLGVNREKAKVQKNGVSASREDN